MVSYGWSCHVLVSSGSPPLNSPPGNLPQLTYNLCNRPNQFSLSVIFTSKLQSDCSHNTMFIFTCFNFGSYGPMISMSFGLQWYHVSVLKASSSNFASFSLLECSQGLFAPSRPKLICNMLNSSPTLSTVNISRWKACRGWYYYYRFHGQ